MLESCLRLLIRSNIIVLAEETDASNQGTSLGQATLTLKGGDAINAYAMTLHWTASSTSITTKTSSSGVVASATSTPETSTPTTVATIVAPSEGLHGGGIAGVIIGALIGFAIVLELLVWFFLQRRRQAKCPGQHDKSDGLFGILGLFKVITRSILRRRRQTTASKTHSESVETSVYVAPDDTIHEMADSGYNDIPELGAEPARNAPYRDDPEQTPRWSSQPSPLQ